jgi:hypothetical protein
MNRKMRVFVLSVSVMVCFLCAFGRPVGAVEVPAKFKEIPLYEGSKVVHAMDMENNAMLSATVKASADAVSDFYKNAMKSSGWKLSFQMDQESAKVLHFQKDKLIFNVAIQTEENNPETTYNLAISSQ